MKLVTSNGRLLRIYDIGPPLYEIEAIGTAMCPHHGWHIVEDAEAREIVRELRGLDAYRCEAIGQSETADRRETAE
jgi:hypothetical protein